MTEPKIALVTGGGGFLGSAIVRMLVAEGVIVRSFARHRYPDLDRLDVEQIKGDLNDAQQVHRACRGAEVVFHTAAKAGLGGPYQAYYRSNVIGTRNVIRGCIDSGVSRLIHTSSPSVVFDSGNMEGTNESAPYPLKYHAHYPRTKAMAEKMVIEASALGLAALVLRPHLIWGPGDNHLAPGIIKRSARLRRIGDGSNRVDTIYIENAAWAHILADRALKADPALTGNIYFISQDDPIPVWEMVNRILSAAGKPPVRKSMSPALAYGIGWVCEAIYKGLHLNADPPLTRFMVRELSTSHWFDISAARRDLGYTPRVSIEEGLKRLAEWFGAEKL